MTNPTSNKQTPCNNSIFHLNFHPKDSIIKKICKAIAFVFIHVITLGTLLVYHYCCSSKHQISTTQPTTPPSIGTPPKTPPPPGGKPPAGVEPPPPGGKPPAGKPKTPPRAPRYHQPSNPLTPSILDYDKDITIPALDTSLHPIRPTTPPLQRVQAQLPTNITPHSLEALAWFQKNGLSPLPTKLLSSAMTLNTHFMCSYPKRLSEHFDFVLEPHIPNTDLDQLHDQCAKEQIRYLDSKYYFVEIPGDGFCFYRSFAIGWLTHLVKNGPAAYQQAIQKIQSLPFYQNATYTKLNKDLIDLLQHCQQNISNMEDLFNKIFLSPQKMQILLDYISKLAIEQYFDTLTFNNEEEIKDHLLENILAAPDLLQNCVINAGRIPETKHLINNIILSSQNSFPENEPSTCVQLLLSSYAGLRETNDTTIASYLEKLLDLARTCADDPHINQAAELLIASLPPRQVEEVQRYQQLHSNMPLALALYLFALANPSTQHILRPLKDYQDTFTVQLESLLDLQKTLLEQIPTDNAQSSNLISTTLKNLWKSKISYSCMHSLLNLDPYTIISTQATRNAHRTTVLGLAQLFETDKNERTAEIMRDMLPQLKQSRIFKAFLQNGLISSLIPQGLSFFDLPDESLKCAILFLFLSKHIEATNSTTPLGNLMKEFLYIGLLKFDQLNHDLSNITTRSKLSYSAISSYTRFDVPTLQFNLEHMNLEQTREYITSVLKFCLRHPEFSSTSHTLFAIFSSLGKNMTLSYDLNNLFIQASQLVHQDPNLSQEFQKYCNNINLLTYQTSMNNEFSPQTHLSLSGIVSRLPDHLVLSGFLAQNQHLLSDPSNPQSATLRNFVRNYNKQYNETIPLILNSLEPRVLNALTKMLFDFKDKQTLFMSNLSQNIYPFKQAFINQLNQLPLAGLKKLFNASLTQAEDVHISAVNNALLHPAFCTLISMVPYYNADNLKAASAEHGFTNTPDVSEATSPIRLLLYNNHYGCLIEKDS